MRDWKNANFLGFRHFNEYGDVVLLVKNCTRNRKKWIDVQSFKAASITTELQRRFCTTHQFSRLVWGSCIMKWAENKSQLMSDHYLMEFTSFLAELSDRKLREVPWFIIMYFKCFIWSADHGPQHFARLLEGHTWKAPGYKNCF